MGYAPKVVLHAPPPDSPLLDEFVEACLRDKVVLICVMGEQCDLIEDIIDELVNGDGTDPSRFITTTSHRGETLGEVLKFARSWTEPKGEGQQVRL